jgi:hypothetical protein
MIDVSIHLAISYGALCAAALATFVRPAISRLQKIGRHRHITDMAAKLPVIVTARKPRRTRVAEAATPPPALPSRIVTARKGNRPPRREPSDEACAEAAAWLVSGDT